MQSFIMKLFAKCSVVFYLQMFFFNNYVSKVYIQLSLGNKVATFLGTGCQLCLLSVRFVAV